MSVGKGFEELAKVASDYTNNGMGKQGAYAAARNARMREQSRPSPKPVPTTTAPQPIIGDADAPRTGGEENA